MATVPDEIEDDDYDEEWENYEPPKEDWFDEEERE